MTDFLSFLFEFYNNQRQFSNDENFVAVDIILNHANKKLSERQINLNVVS